jgi:hypothetical protein
MALTLLAFGFYTIGLAAMIGNIQMIFDGTHPFLHYPFRRHP